MVVESGERALEDPLVEFPSVSHQIVEVRSVPPRDESREGAGVGDSSTAGGTVALEAAPIEGQIETAPRAARGRRVVFSPEHLEDGNQIVEIAAVQQLPVRGHLDRRIFVGRIRSSRDRLANVEIGSEGPGSRQAAPARDVQIRDSRIGDAPLSPVAVTREAAQFCRQLRSAPHRIRAARGPVGPNHPRRCGRNEQQNDRKRQGPFDCAPHRPSSLARPPAGFEAPWARTGL